MPRSWPQPLQPFQGLGDNNATPHNLPWRVSHNSQQAPIVFAGDALRRGETASQPVGLGHALRRTLAESALSQRRQLLLTSVPVAGSVVGVVVLVILLTALVALCAGSSKAKPKARPAASTTTETRTEGSIRTGIQEPAAAAATTVPCDGHPTAPPPTVAVAPHAETPPKSLTSDKTPPSVGAPPPQGSVAAEAPAATPTETEPRSVTPDSVAISVHDSTAGPSAAPDSLHRDSAPRGATSELTFTEVASAALQEPISKPEEMQGGFKLTESLTDVAIPPEALQPVRPGDFKPWHATHMFSTMKSGHIDPLTVAQISKAIVTLDKRIHDLTEDALRWKYGSEFARRCKINTRRCVGVGSTATVYCGTCDGKKAAFKVMNIAKTAPYIMSMLQRSVLTELEVYEMLEAISKDHPGRKHLLTIMDCLMFPPLDVMQGRVEFDVTSLGDGATRDGSTIVSVDGKVFEFAAHSLDNGLEVKNQFDMCTQVIMVYPLCEIGQLLRLCRGTLKIPSTAIPLECMMAVINMLDDKEYNLLIKQHAKQLLHTGAEGHVRDMRSAADVSQVLMEAWDNGEKAYLRAGQLPVPWFNLLKLQMLLQVTDAVQYLHDRGVIHCDIKLDNVFLTRDDRMSPFKLSAKLGDLGMCRSLNPTDSGEGCEESREEMLSSRFTTFVKGTPGYCAPEMFNNGHMSRATDIYSLAVLCSIALSPNAAFIKRTENDVQLVPRFPKDMHPRLRKVLEAALGVKPKARPGLGELKEAIGEEMARISDILASTFDEEMVAARDRSGTDSGDRSAGGGRALMSSSVISTGNFNSRSASASDLASSSFRGPSLSTLHAVSHDNFSESHINDPRVAIDRALMLLDPPLENGPSAEAETPSTSAAGAAPPPPPAAVEMAHDAPISAPPMEPYLLPEDTASHPRSLGSDLGVGQAPAVLATGK